MVTVAEVERSYRLRLYGRSQWAESTPASVDLGASPGISAALPCLHPTAHISAAIWLLFNQRHGWSYIHSKFSLKLKGFWGQNVLRFTVCSLKWLVSSLWNINQITYVKLKHFKYFHECIYIVLSNPLHVKVKLLTSYKKVTVHSFIACRWHVGFAEMESPSRQNHRLSRQNEGYRRNRDC